MTRAWIYFIQQGDDGPIKIGTAVDPVARLRLLQTGNPERLTLRGKVEAWPGGEGALHRHFKAARMSGEWFRPGPELVAYADSPESQPRPATLARPKASSVGAGTTTDDLVTVPQAAGILGLSYPGANDLLRRRGVREFDRIGNSRLYDRAAILALAAEVRRSGRPKMSQPPGSGA